MDRKSGLGLSLIGVLALCMFWQSRVADRETDNWLKIIESDGYGYYVYLPAIAQNDFNYDFIDAIHEEYYDQAKPLLKQDSAGNYYTKYFVGTSILMSPFYFLGSITAWISGYSQDGFSLPYQWFAFLSTLSYFLASLYLIVLILKRLGISPLTRFLVIISITFATNIGVYVIREPCLSHIYALFLISLITHLFLKYLQHLQARTFLSIAFLSALLVLVRPTSILALLILPFLVKLQGMQLKTVIPQLRFCLIGAFIFLVVVGIQPLFYYLQTGAPFIWSYQEEGFDFLAPEITNFLFSFRKGWFIYSPVMLLTLVGTFHYWRNNKSLFALYYLFLIPVVWVLSSWWNWWYGGSFGSRSMIDFIPLTFIPIAHLIDNINKTKKLLFVVFLGACMALSFIQQYQYLYSIIHYDEMDFSKYKQVFLQTDSFYRFTTHDEKDPTRNRKVVATKSYYNYRQTDSVWRQDRDLSVNPTVIVDANNPYGDVFDFSIDSLKLDSTQYDVYLHVRARINPQDIRSHALMVLNIKGDSNRWGAHKIMNEYRELEGEKWCNFYFDLTEVEGGYQSLSAYIFNDHPIGLKLDSMEVHINYCTEVLELEE